MPSLRHSMQGIQETQLSQGDRAMLRVIQYFGKSLIRNDTLEYMAYASPYQ